MKCPRLYYLRNVYKDPKTGHKITVMTPPLALGQVVHEVIDGISTLPLEKRFDLPLANFLDASWSQIAGKRGGFISNETEAEYKKRALEMLKNIEANPGPLKNKAIKLKSENGLPYYWFNEEENIILCGKVDWIEYLEESDAVHIIDFKTGKNEESEDSMQLPVYFLLASNLQTRRVSKASYWYLNSNSSPVEQKLPKADDAYEKVLEVAKRMKLGRQINYFKCPKGGCFACRSLERVLLGEGELVGTSEYNQDIYILPKSEN